MHRESYVLITPAKNEEAYIEMTIKSVISQTILPKRWVIVSDGSTDHTDEIASTYVAKYDFIRLARAGAGSERNFGSKVRAIRVGAKQLKGIEYDFLGNLDADVSFEPNYYESILEKFQQNLKLGIAGGIILNRSGRFERWFDNPERSVAGAVQLFRRECYEKIGGLIPMKYGAEDAIAEVTARMHGWEVRSFSELEVLHHRRTGTEGLTIWRARFRQGVADYSLGYHPLFELAKCLRRIILEKPYLLGGVLRMCGYCWSGLRGDERTISADFVRYLREEQMHRLTPQFLSCKKMGPREVRG